MLEPYIDTIAIAIKFPSPYKFQEVDFVWVVMCSIELQLACALDAILSASNIPLGNNFVPSPNASFTVYIHFHILLMCYPSLDHLCFSKALQYTQLYQLLSFLSDCLLLQLVLYSLLNHFQFFMEGLVTKCKFLHLNNIFY